MEKKLPTGTVPVLTPTITTDIRDGIISEGLGINSAGINSTGTKIGRSSLPLDLDLAGSNFAFALRQWIDIVGGVGPMQIVLETADLPDAELAAIDIDRVNRRGLPVAGTITLDADAAGVGWFIDSTPDEHGEFAAQLSDNAFQATDRSPALDQYDLHTVLIHELGHLWGFYEGNDRLENFVTTINGIPYANLLYLQLVMSGGEKCFIDVMF